MALLGKGTLTGTAAALGSVTNLGQAKRIIFKIVTSGTETVSVTGLLDGTTYTGSKLRAINLNTGAVHSSADMDDGDYLIDNLAFDQLKFTGSSTSDTKTVVYRVHRD